PPRRATGRGRGHRFKGAMTWQSLARHPPPRTPPRPRHRRSATATATGTRPARAASASSTPSSRAPGPASRTTPARPASTCTAWSRWRTGHECRRLRPRARAPRRAPPRPPPARAGRRPPLRVVRPPPDRQPQHPAQHQQRARAATPLAPARLRALHPHPGRPRPRRAPRLVPPLRTARRVLLRRRPRAQRARCGRADTGALTPRPGLSAGRSGAGPSDPHPAPPSGAGRSPHEITQRHADRPGETDEGVECRGLLSGLDPDDGRPVDLGGQGDGFLRERGVQACGPDGLAHGPALSEDPRGRCSGRHSATVTGPSSNVCRGGPTLNDLAALGKSRWTGAAVGPSREVLIRPDDGATDSPPPRTFAGPGRSALWDPYRVAPTATPLTCTDHPGRWGR